MSMDLTAWSENRRWHWSAMLWAIALVTLVFGALSYHAFSSMPDGRARWVQDVPAPAFVSAATPATTTLSGWPVPETLRPGTPAAAAVLVGVFATGVVALLLALSQYSAHDIGLTGACLLWVAHTELGLLASTGHPAIQSGVMLVILSAFAVLVGWHLQRLLRLPVRAQAGATVMAVPLLVSLLAWMLNGMGAMDGPIAQALVLLLLLGCGLCLLAEVIRLAGRRGGRRRRVMHWSVMLALAAVLGCGTQELVTLVNQSAGSEPVWHAGSWVMTRWCVLALLTVLTASRIVQVAATLRQLERQQHSSHARNRQVQHSLKEARARLDSRERNDTWRRQRDRFLRELHDELARKLSSARQMLHQGNQPGQLQSLLDASLADLQHALQTLDASGRPLSGALRQLRRRIEPSLVTRGVQLAWVVDGGVDSAALGPAVTLQILRVAQQALEETVEQTARIRHVALVLEQVRAPSGAHLRLMIYDDRHASVTTLPRQTWVSMRRQIESTGAKLCCGAQPDGWTVELLLPLRT